MTQGWVWGVWGEREREREREREHQRKQRTHGPTSYICKTQIKPTKKKKKTPPKVLPPRRFY
jgi:galactose-1-phosphate uridylyltransferase